MERSSTGLLDRPVPAGHWIVAKTNIAFHGVAVPKGALIDARFAATNRDPVQFERPEEIDPQRRNAESYLDFSSGTD